MAMIVTESDSLEVTETFIEKQIDTTLYIATMTANGYSQETESSKMRKNS